MRLMIWSNAPYTPTGYGGQVAGMLPRLKGMGHEVAVISNFGLSGASLNWKGYSIYPLRMERQNREVLDAYVKHFNADAVISLYDIWSLPEDAKERMGVPWIAMVPVDGKPVSDGMKKRLNKVDWIVSYSKHADRQLKAAGYETTYVPHSIDLDVFKPAESKADIRDRLGFPQDAFVVSVVAANKGFPPRKSWPELLAGFKLFNQKYPKSILYCHTTKRPYGSKGEGVYLERLRQKVLGSGIPDSAFSFPQDMAMKIGVPDKGVAEIYQASDVMLLPSRGEGFGLPIIEAQATGCPVITNKCSSMPELTVNGISIEPLQPQWLPQFGYYWQIPSIERIRDALEEVFHWSETTRKKNAQEGIEFVEDYEWNAVWEKYWVPFMEKVEREIW